VVFASRENIKPSAGSLAEGFLLLGVVMREDMYKVIVERPRRWKDGYTAAARLRSDHGGPTRLGTRAGYGYRSLNENLAPLRRYLRAQVGRPWDKVFSEICANIDRRNTVQQHIHRHIRSFIAVDVGYRDGQWVDLSNRRAFLPGGSGIYQELYVDPHTRLIRLNKDYESWRQSAAKRRQREEAEIAARRRTLNERTFLLLLDDVWFRVEVDVLPNNRYIEEVINGEARRCVVAEPRYDVVLRRHISRAMSDELRECKRLYGSDDLYAVRKRQISRREIKMHGLRQAG
jgi:hypothetical protein